MTGSASSATWVRRLAHVAVALGSWLTFAALWLWQIDDYRPTHLELYPVFIGVVLVIMVGAGRGWIEWNRNIYRRRHNRTSPLIREIDFSHDVVGRRVRCHSDLRYGPGQTIVSVSGDGAKVYRPGRRVRGAGPLDRPDPVGSPRPHWLDGGDSDGSVLRPTTYVPAGQIDELVG